MALGNPSGEAQWPSYFVRRGALFFRAGARAHKVLFAHDGAAIDHSSRCGWSFCMMRSGLAIAAFLAAMSAAETAFAQQAGGTCAALLIGNSNYMQGGEPPLREPVSNARTLGNELKRLGFDVDVREDLGRDAMQRALEAFYGRLRTGMTALIFFSGYGIQANRRSFIIPVDVNIFNESEVQPNGISLDTALAAMSRRGAGVKIAIIDAARRMNPFEIRFRRVGDGLAPLSSPTDTLVIFSANAGSPGELLPIGGGSLFVAELVKEIQTPGATAEEAFSHTKVGVSRASAKQQNPMVSSSLTRDFSFADCRRAVADERDRLSIPSCRVENVAPPKSDGPPPAERVRAFDARIRQNPRDAAAYSGRSQLYLNSHDYTRAMPDLDEAVRLNPNNPEVFNNRCWARTMLGDTARALQDCDTALRLRSAYGDALDSRGLIHLKRCENAEALSDYESAMRYNPAQASVRFGLGIAKLRTGDRSGNEDIVAAKAIKTDIAQEFRGYGITIGNER
jgi:Caspase domain